MKTSPPPRLVLNSHCQVCEFKKRCHTEATAKDDLSLLRGMAETEVDGEVGAVLPAEQEDAVGVNLKAAAQIAQRVEDDIVLALAASARRFAPGPVRCDEDEPALGRLFGKSLERDLGIRLAAAVQHDDDGIGTQVVMK